MPASIRIARIAGIDVRVHVSWLLIFGLVIMTLIDQFSAEYPFWSDAKTLGVAAVVALLFFASVIAHELAHAGVARAYRMEVSSITLFMLGGVANLTKEPVSARAELLMASAGPATSLVIGIVGLLVERLADAPFLQPVRAGAQYLGQVNLALAVFNLLPGFPLDGGRVLRSIVWGVSGDRASATRIAARGGQALAVLLTLAGAFFVFRFRDPLGAWYFLIAYFLWGAASASLTQERVASVVGGARVRQLMTASPRTVAAEMRIGALVRDVLLPLNLRAVLVAADDRVTGLVTIGDLGRVDQEEWPVTALAAVLRPAGDLPELLPDDTLMTALERFSETDAPLLPVTEEGGRLVGALERDALEGYVRMREVLGATASR